MWPDGNAAPSAKASAWEIEGAISRDVRMSKILHEIWHDGAGRHGQKEDMKTWNDIVHEEMARVKMV